jgi:hypothetical protein
MPTDWERLYAEAFHELDPEKVPELCDRTRHAINERLIELSAPTISAQAQKEREQLFEALRKLLLYEYERRPPK